MTPTADAVEAKIRIPGGVRSDIEHEGRDGPLSTLPPAYRTALELKLNADHA